MRFSFAMILTFVIFAGGIFAQNGLPDTGIKDNLVIGVVKITGAEKIVLETKDGSIDAIMLSTTVFKRLSPDNLSLAAAVDAVFADISMGDRVVVTGKVSEDKKSVYANKVFLVKGSEIEAQAEKRRAEWRQRGVSGKVTALDAPANTVTIKFSSVTGAETVIRIVPKEGAVFRRYSRTSARYSDTTESSYSAISVGDNLQALGDRSVDGTVFTAEEILTGAFVTVAGTIKSIDVEKSVVTISDLTSKTDISISVVDSSLLKRFPEEAAQRLARFQTMGGGMPQGGRPAGGGQASGGGGQGPGGGRGMGDINEMLNRFPTINVSELTVGELIAVSSPKSDDPSKLTAIKLLAGVGPFLALKPTTGRQRGGQGVSAGINVPGLDSFDF